MKLLIAKILSTLKIIRIYYELDDYKKTGIIFKPYYWNFFFDNWVRQRGLIE